MSDATVDVDSTPESDTPTENDPALSVPPSRVVAIGASAGGLDALTRFFSGVDDEAASDLSFVVIQHLSPDYKSMMPELLSRHTDLPIHVVQNDMKVEPRSIYLIPPKKNMTIVDGRLVLVDKPSGHDLNLPIDIFFRSLADEVAERAVAVVLSGTGSDGTRGVRAIKEADGTVFVQDPQEASFDGMPLSAMHTGMVDFVLPAEQMAEELRLFLEHPPPVDASSAALPDDDEAWERVLGQVRSVTGIDFTSYRRPTLWRRMVRRISIHRLPSLRAYMEFLRTDEVEAQTLAREFLIGVTKFFRDPSSWEALEHEVLIPLLRDKADNDEPFKAWVAGCSSGEEAYTLAMILREITERERLRVECKIFATDVVQDYLDVASRGVYPESIVGDIPSKRVSQHLIRSGDHYQVTDSVRRMVIFSKHDLVRDPPFSKMDLVACRNVLIYFGREQQNRVIGLLHYALNQGGALFLGSSESVGSHESAFEEVDRRAKIFRNLFVSKRFADHESAVIEPRYPTMPTGAVTPPTTRAAIGDSLSTALAEEIGVIGIVVDGNFQIIHAMGEFRRLAALPEQGFTTNLLKLLPTSAAPAIRSAVRSAIDRGERRQQTTVMFGSGDASEAFDVVARPLSQKGSQANSYALLVLTPVGADVDLIRPDPIEIDPSGQQQIEELELSLARAREELSSTVEDLEASNEELQASNEELLAANEELQSTNEELQSVNEELHTVNVEFQQKTEELAEVNSEMSHLLDSTEIGTIFLDADLNIRRLTTSGLSLFSARLDDVGRPLSDFTSVFGPDESTHLVALAREVAATGRSREDELQTQDGRWYLRRITPFVDGDGQHDGVVVSFVDIQAAKTSQADLARSEGRLLEAQKIARMGDFTWEVETGEVTWSPTMYEIFGVPEGETLSFAQVHDEIHIEPERDGIEQWLTESLERDDGTLPPYRYRTIRRDGQPIDLEVQGVIRHHPDGARYVVGTALDVTARVELEYTNERIMESSISGIFIQSLVGHGVQVVNSRLAEIWGHPVEEMTNWSDEQIDDAVHPDDRAAFDVFLERVRTAPDDQIETVEFRGVGSSGEIHWLLVMGSVFDRDAQGAPVSMLGFGIDVTEQKVVEAELLQRNEELAQFASLAAHDLQEPLRTLRNFTEVLEEDLGADLDPQVAKSLEFISSSATRMSQLIRDLLEYSRVGRNESPEGVDMKEVAVEVLADLATRIEETGAEVTIGDLPVLAGRRDDYVVLIRNLLTNALKYRRPDVAPTVTLDSTGDDRRPRLSVSDNGIGIAAEHHDRIFGIFQRLHPRSEYEGTGIGLAQSRKIVESLGGRIWCESEPGAGTTFHFTVPRLLSAARSEQPA